MGRRAEGTSRCMRTSGPGRVGGVGRGWSETRLCVQRCSPASNRAGLLSRFVVVRPWSVASGSYPTRASIGSSMDNWSGRRTTRGVTTCLAGSRRGAGGVAREESRFLHTPPTPPCRASAERPGPPHSRSLGGRPDALSHLRTGGADHA